MPNHISNEKRLRQAAEARSRNRFYKATLFTESKKLRHSADYASASEQLKVVFSLLDKMAKKRIIHKNKADNQKSVLNKFVKSLEKAN